MKITVSFQHLEHTPSLDERIQEKSQKLKKYMEGKIHAKWNCYVEDHQQFAEIELIGPKCSFHASAHADSLYKSIDLVVAKLEKQMEKKHAKMKNRLHRKIEEPVILDYESAWAEYEDEYKDVV